MSTYLMRTELGVIQFTNGEGHVLFAYVLHNSCAVTEHISVTYITCLPHVILQVLPTSAGRKTWCKKGGNRKTLNDRKQTAIQKGSYSLPTCHNNSVFWAPGRGPVPRPLLHHSTSTPTATTASSSTSRELDSQTVSVIVIAVTSVNSILGIPAFQSTLNEKQEY